MNTCPHFLFVVENACKINMVIHLFKEKAKPNANFGIHAILLCFICTEFPKSCIFNLPRLLISGQICEETEQTFLTCIMHVVKFLCIITQYRQDLIYIWVRWNSSLKFAYNNDESDTSTPPYVFSPAEWMLPWDSMEIMVCWCRLKWMNNTTTRCQWHGPAWLTICWYILYTAQVTLSINQHAEIKGACCW